MNLGDLALHKISGVGGINLTESIQPVIFIQTDEPIATKKGDVWVNASFAETGNFYYRRNKPTGTYQDNDIWVNISGLRTYITMESAVDFITNTGSSTGIVGDDLLVIHESTQEANKLVTLWKNAITRIQGKFDRLYRYSTAENDWLSVESFYWDGDDWIKFSANSAGDQWFEATDSAGWTARSSHTSVVFDNKMWVIGGYDGTNRLKDVWYSSDGTSWTRATSSAGWTARYGHTSVVFDNKMWVIGGNDSSGRRRDVWYSSNGTSWTQATDSAEWTGREKHTSVVFDNKMWVIGGSSKNDVWYSY